jgi:tRNA (guanine-N7-)-methyltransferase
MPRVRVHQHVNPLAKYFRELPIKPLLLRDVFANPDLPLHLDIGCGRGRFLLEMAGVARKQNFLGVEIREPLVIEAVDIGRRKNLKNLHYEFCNATFDLEVLLEKIPPETLSCVTIQFPDPWFKKRHAKRRMVRDQLVETIAKRLAADGTVFVQTDVEFLAEEMSGLFIESGFRRSGLEANPFRVKTEREISVENRRLPIYRSLFGKRK